MGFLDLLRPVDINRGLEEYDVQPQAVLLDVRTPAEYGEGHIPGSRNVPLQAIDKVREVTDNKRTPLFVYCASGARSRAAAGLLRQMGYVNVRNIGGIAAYRGRVVS